MYHNTGAEYIVGEVKKQKPAAAIAALILLALLGVGIWFSFSPSSTGDATVDLIAILPFQNRRADADFEFAVEQCRKLIDLDSGGHYGHQLLALIYITQGRKAEALAEGEKIDLGTSVSLIFLFVARFCFD